MRATAEAVVANIVRRARFVTVGLDRDLAELGRHEIADQYLGSGEKQEAKGNQTYQLGPAIHFLCFSFPQ